ncbi:unnamed protein product [Bursaphelenchus xylophilus]|uniref:(pine wood nematode) hypothetical protein n=1 Tax=Bursaphelenchus xylophilus TaxID=6326 RepID=A0A1I7RJU0_BURXY|nr:unnamed protein product [Bursaphelenchus xylophilus]CAG9129066.1 unnamed protein product [Bursaphelenchus xylophilus]
MTALVGVVDCAMTKVHTVGKLVCYSHWNPEQARVTLVNEGEWATREFVTVPINEHHWFFIKRRFFDRQVDLHLKIRHNCGPDGEFREFIEEIDDGHHNIGSVDITPYDVLEEFAKRKEKVLEENAESGNITKIEKNDGDF